ncbi:hypothetical protein GCM10010909_15630 [Acidocella aquatica]|uniref:Glycosyl transferase family 1 domain-containing protein n=2 Tax=Acidocella aquatica TaxID=1922313 RepID=A0ABQ6A6E4_9PROT|nr:hypothetical protein GCM10010909_15630 [Acidocella aquatica]
MLTLRSFTHFGHAFHLWLYQPLVNALPEGVVVRDANQIIPEQEIFRNTTADPGCGVGRGSLGAFSDLFRYKLLYEQGGIWVDMDVTCLRPFDICGDYMFRSHKIGVVGNIMKCPPRSPLMRDTYAEAAATIRHDCPWLAANQILNKYIVAHKLTGYIIDGFCNADDWRNVVSPLVNGFVTPPASWHAIHWLNEYWRGLQNGSVIDGDTPAPDKDTPPLGSTLHELYRAYGLADIYEPYSPPRRPNAALPLTAQAAPGTNRLDVLLPALARNGASRIVAETLAALAPATTCRLHLLESQPVEYPLPAHKTLTLHRPTGNRTAQLRAIAFEILEAGAKHIHTHLVRAEDLETLWGFGLETIPVIHTSRPGWLNIPTRYNHPQVPLVVACAESVAAQLRADGLNRPLTVLRHELQTHPDTARLNAERRAIRLRHGISGDTVLIGMAGRFSSHKSHTRAVGVLSALQARGVAARLLILGGWDDETGSGRAAYAAFMRAAVEAGVVADIICAGEVSPAAPYYAAFDVLLNTSSDEGYSIAILEALASGCPVVATNTGGNGEFPPGNIALVTDPEDSEAFAGAILSKLTAAARHVPQPPVEPGLIPELWNLLARHTVPAQATLTGALILTQSLELGGPASSLARLAAALPETRKLLVGVFGAVTAAHQATFTQAGTKLLCAAGLPLAAQAQSVLGWIAHFQPRTLCFWNLRPELKLLLTKLLEPTALRILDVSPGPMLFDELDAAASFQHRIAYRAEAYFARLDRFIALYKGGEAPAPARNAVLPLGTPTPPGFIPLPAPYLLPPRGFNPALVVGTICRIVPDKQVERLLEVAAKLRQRVPGATLMVVGGPDATSVPYFQSLLAAAESQPSIRFTGPADDPLPFLRLFRVFLLTGRRQGCPNASLEAMSLRLPVVAQPGGGIAEQVLHGKTGYLAETPEAMARRVTSLLRDEPLRARMGEAGYKHWQKNFSIDEMTARYDKIMFTNQV